MNPESSSFIRSFEAKIDDVSMPRRTVTAKINTNTVDRYNTVIVPRGGNWDNFMRSGPAVLWEHGNDPNRGRLPVAHCNSLKYRKADDDILGVMQFKDDDFSSQVMEMYASGTLRSFSVEFLPDVAKSSRPTSEEVRAKPEWGTAHTIYRSWELTGFSAVSYPGNPEALALAIERGLWVPDETKKMIEENRALSVSPSIELETDDSQGRSEPEKEETTNYQYDFKLDEIISRQNKLEDLLRAMAEGNGSHGGYTTKNKDDDDDKDNDDKEDRSESTSDDDEDDEYDRYITHEGGQYVVHAEDGKVLGKHKTKGEAVAQLQAIEANKGRSQSSEVLEASLESERVEPLPVVQTISPHDLEMMGRQIVEVTLPLARTYFFALRLRGAQDFEDWMSGQV